MTRSGSLARGFLTAALLVGVLAALAAPALYAAGASPSFQAAPSGVLISEFRARGPNGGQDEIIELYNSSPDPVDMSGWSLWQSNATGGPPNSLKDADGNAAFPAGTILRPGQHFLAANDNGYSGAVQPDWAYTAGQIQNNGGIAIKNVAGGIEDAAGMSIGVAPGFLEGSPLPAWTNARNTDESHERRSAGGANDCTDTGDNAADFLPFVASDPQNTSSPLSLCGSPIEATTTTIPSISPPNATVGQPVTVRFRVAAAAGTPTGGTVIIRDGGAPFCTGALVNGQGQCTEAFATAGNKSLTASYSGHSLFGASTSAPVPYQVAKADSVTTILSDNPDPSGLSQSVTVTFKVESQTGSGTPTGDVRVIVDGTGNSCTGTLAGGQGQCVLNFFGPGTKSLHAEYQGDAGFNPSTSAAEPHVVQPGPTKTRTPGPPTKTPTPTNTLPAGFTVMINEIAWSGTSAAATDEWIELFNNTNSPINLAGWRLRALDGEPNIALTGIIPARGFFLLERAHDTTVSDIDADQIYTGALADTVERLYLYTPVGGIADYANTYGIQWLAGSIAGNRSMERRGPYYDSTSTWVTNTGVVRNGRDADGDPINGTPKRQNWATMVTLTPSPRPTIFPSRTLPPQPHPVINEFLARAAYDWNQDGKVDVFDEYIEVANLGPVDVNLQGWRLDDEANGGSDPFTLPSMVLKPGERALFYGLRTNILLSDGGDTVRLLSPANVIFDAQTYPVVTVADESWCRLPDLRGSWYSDCFPTPNLPNQRRGQLPSLPPGTGLEEQLCLLADTLPEEFILAECRGFGEDMFSMRYWDRAAWWSEFRVLQNGSKWESFVQ